MLRASAAALLLAAAVACASEADVAPTPAETVSGYGLELALPEGWTGSVDRVSPDSAVVLRSAAFELDARAGPSGAAAGADGVYLEIADLGPPPDGVGRDPSWDADPTLPLRLAADDLAGPYEHGFRAGATFGAVVRNRALMIRVRFGSDPGSVDLVEINEILAGLRVAPPPRG
jgi:hypothetical protein